MYISNRTFPQSRILKLSRIIPSAFFACAGAYLLVQGINLFYELKSASNVCNVTSNAICNLSSSYQQAELYFKEYFISGICLLLVSLGVVWIGSVYDKRRESESVSEPAESEEQLEQEGNRTVTVTGNFCANCGKPIRPNAKFCRSCGTEL
jgi:zinc-ribbon domain